MSRRSAHVDLVTPAGVTVASLGIHLLAGTSEDSVPPPLLVAKTGADGDARAKIQLLEGTEYRYEVTPAPTHLAPPNEIEPGELFCADTREGRQGRLRTGNRTGTLRVTLRTPDGGPSGHAFLEVRSRKRDYLAQYRWMLRDIAELATEVVVDRFAPTWQQFCPDQAHDPRTLYQRFVFLEAILRDEGFQAAIHRILAQPHHAWVTVERERPSSLSIPLSSELSRQYVRPGPRMHAPDLPGGSVPERFRVSQHVETVDTPENRFVKHALETWRDTVSRIRAALERLGASGSQERGQREAGYLLDELDEWLAEGFFREVGPLQALPFASPVLQKREGYRDILAAWLQFECAARLTWSGGDSVYYGGQRDVATLYEYWVFLELAWMIGDLCERPVDFATLIEHGEHGLNLNMKRGQEQAVTGTLEMLGQRLDLTLFYNRTFPRGVFTAEPARNSRSWSRSMRPDYSLHVAPRGSASDFWLHFDAKYRLETLPDLLGPEDGDDDDGEAREPSDQCQNGTREDLLKMHAYRDAIHHTSGAYVLYPGNQAVHMPRYHEGLPSIGAFPMRPTRNGEGTGTKAIRAFLMEVLRQVAQRTGQHERALYWERQVFTSPPPALDGLQALPFLATPPADTCVFLARIPNQTHLDWVARNGRFAMRAGGNSGKCQGDATAGISAILSASWGLLYGPDSGVHLLRVVGDVEVWTQDDLLTSGHPSAHGSAAWLCLPVEVVPDVQVPWQTAERFEELGAPVCMTWQQVFEVAAGVPLGASRTRSLGRCGSSRDAAAG